MFKDGSGRLIPVHGVNDMESREKESFISDFQTYVSHDLVSKG